RTRTWRRSASCQAFTTHVPSGSIFFSTILSPGRPGISGRSARCGGGVARRHGLRERGERLLGRLEAPLRPLLGELEDVVVPRDREPGPEARGRADRP